MSNIANKLFKEHLSHNIRFIFLVLILMIMILSTFNSLNHLSAATLFSYPETIADDSYGIRQLSLADINKDTYLDIIALNTTSNSIDAYINPSSTNATWIKKPVLNNTPGLISFLTIDIDNDSDIDIIYSDTVSLAINLHVNLDGLGNSWQTSSITSTAGAIKSMCAGDLNKDGNLDIVAADDSRGRIFYMQNKISTNNSWESFSIYEDPKNPSSLSCNDIDNDGDIDIVSTSQTLETVLWHENISGNGVEWETHTISNTSAFANKIYVADIDNDNDYDVISTNPASSTIQFHKNTEGNGAIWESTTIYENFSGPTDLFVIDIDSDGDNDVLTSSNQTKNVLWLENIVSPQNNWTSYQIGSIINYPSTIKSADIDNDGDNDIIFGSLADSNLRIANNILSQTSYDSMSDILMSSRDSHISAILGQAFASNNNLFGADNSILISIYDPNRNSNSQTIETIPSSDIAITNLNTLNSVGVLLTETNVNSGMFIGEFLVDNDYSTTNIKAKDLHRIEVSYKANNKIRITAHTNTNQEYVIIDGTKPSISNLYPNSNVKDSISDYVFEALIEDPIIGLGPDLETVASNIIFVIDEYAFEPNLTYLGYGKWAANLKIHLSEGNHTWQISSSDLLGNTAHSDLLALEVDTSPPYFAHSGINKSKTGDTAVNSTLIEQSSNRKSIRLGFDDNIDGESVNKDGSDFKMFLNNVEMAIESAQWFNSPTTSKHIFLNLKDELPPDATPTVKLVGSIKDDAGNTSSFDKTTVSDGIKPDIRFTLTGTNNEGRVITYDKLILEVISDEQVINPNSSDVTIQMLDSNSTVVPITPTSFSTIKQNMSWRWEYMFGNLSTFGKIYNVDLQLQDFAGNSVNISNPDLTNNSKSTLFELDTLIQAGLLDIGTEPKPYSYINIDYSIESVEYQHDSHNKISITQSSVDGMPVTVQTHNDVLFTIPPPEEGWTVGKHKIEMTVMDDAGNSYLYEEYFIVDVEPLFTIKLKPGFNLISLPSNPSDSNINSVIPLTHSVNLIMTYDPSNGGNWLVSERNPETNRFEGAITQIDSSKAYLLRTNSFQSLEIGLRNTFLHDGNLPSTISLHKGWNFVPIINISSQSISTQGIVANEYFKNINPTSILGINQFNNLAPIDRNEMVLYGKGYLVYLDDDDVLIPPK